MKNGILDVLSKDGLVDLLTDVYHSMLYAYQKALGAAFSPKVGSVLTRTMLRQLQLHVAKEETPTLCKPHVALEEFEKLLIQHRLVGDIKITRIQRGFEVNVRGCKFAGKWHPELPQASICLWALSVAAIVAKATPDRAHINVTSQLTADGSHSQVILEG